jgi:hypothetical protein
VHGLAVYGLVVASALWMLRQGRRRFRDLPEPQRNKGIWLAYGLQVSLVVFLFNGLTTSRIYSEAPWWILAMPAALGRAIENAIGSPAAEQAPHPTAERATRPSTAELVGSR